MAALPDSNYSLGIGKNKGNSVHNIQIYDSLPSRACLQVVIVTGAGHGIGRAIADRFAAEGAHVTVNDVAAARMDRWRLHGASPAYPGERSSSHCIEQTVRSSLPTALCPRK
jgi:hypothetical protein